MPWAPRSLYNSHMADHEAPVTARMRVELRVRGTSSRLLAVAFDGFDVRADGAETVITGGAADEAEALGLIEHATALGFTIIGWRRLDGEPRHDGEPSTTN